jgi:hypothetical protein
MIKTFETNKEVIVYAFNKIIFCAKNNWYIFLVQSVWWITSDIGLQQGLVLYINNLKI